MQNSATLSQGKKCENFDGMYEMKTSSKFDFSLAMHNTVEYSISQRNMHAQCTHIDRNAKCT